MGKWVSWYAQQYKSKTKPLKRITGKLSKNPKLHGLWEDYYSLTNEFSALMGSTKVQIAPAVGPPSSSISLSIRYKWTPSTMRAASNRTFNPAPLSSFNHFSCNFLLLLLLLLRVMLLLHFHPHQITPVASLCSSVTGCRRLFVVILKPWCRCMSTHSCTSSPGLCAPATAISSPLPGCLYTWSPIPPCWAQSHIPSISNLKYIC